MSTRTCSVAGCERRHYGRGYCRAHHARWRRHGDPAAERPLGRKTPGGISYWSVHHRLAVERGPAGSHACAECAGPAVDWSYDGADPDERTDPIRGYRYSLDLARYRPRCRSCHRRATVAAHPGTPAPLDPARVERLYRAGATARGIAALLNTSPHIVLATLRARDVPIRNRDRRPTAPEHEARRARPTTSEPPTDEPITSTTTRTQTTTQTTTRAPASDRAQRPKATTRPLHPDPMVAAACPDGPAAPEGPRSC